jgi:hypothetical protein
MEKIFNKKNIIKKIIMTIKKARTLLVTTMLAVVVFAAASGTVYAAAPPPPGIILSGLTVSVTGDTVNFSFRMDFDATVNANSADFILISFFSSDGEWVDNLQLNIVKPGEQNISFSELIPGSYWMEILAIIYREEGTAGSITSNTLVSEIFTIPNDSTNGNGGDENGNGGGGTATSETSPKTGDFAGGNMFLPVLFLLCAAGALFAWRKALKADK